MQTPRTEQVQVSNIYLTQGLLGLEAEIKITKNTRGKTVDMQEHSSYCDKNTGVPGDTNYGSLAFMSK